MKKNKHEPHEQECMRQEMEFSANYRWQHWVRAGSIVALTATGFYIAEPFLTPISNGTPTNFMQAIIRSIHIVFGFLLATVIIGKSYLFIFASKHEVERNSLKDLFSAKVWIQQICYYILLCKHPKLKGVYNPIQFVAYIGFYIMIFILILTGFVLYANVYHQGFGGLIQAPMKSLEFMMGGLALVRQIHHISTWGIILFVFGHVYMVVFNAVFSKEGGMDAIFSGMKWHKEH